MASNEEQDSEFFEKERGRLIAEISSGFEQLLTEQNKLNQKLDHITGVGGEFSALAALWSNLHELMRQQVLVASELNKSTSGGYPGSGSHVIGR